MATLDPTKAEPQASLTPALPRACDSGATDYGLERGR
jgi:hypothetical protein